MGSFNRLLVHFGIGSLVSSNDVAIGSFVSFLQVLGGIFKGLFKVALGSLQGSNLLFHVAYLVLYQVVEVGGTGVDLFLQGSDVVIVVRAAYKCA